MILLAPSTDAEVIHQIHQLHQRFTVGNMHTTCTVPSIVTVSKILPLVGFGRFCKKNLGFRFGFGSHN